ncbi:hypothetical protein ElyMa_006627100 [Elysia marginata]|uniref:Uncharacterized protein n=1 Tax=Elysia marginata TaxID=1093978 RepID=A0AAV4IH88_9GAST|nr:hypothetical protein ElyMa_006627100 [Elysia marginata]
MMLYLYIAALRGSIGVKYQVEYEAFDKNTTKPANYEEVKEKLQEVKVKLLKLDKVNETYLHETFGAAVEKVLKQVKEINKDVCSIQDICEDPVRYQCNRERRLCVHKCSVKDVCPKNADCRVSETGAVQCPCKNESGRIYDGPNCTVMADGVSRPGLSTEQIIAASVGSCAALIFVASLIAIVIVYRRRKQKAAKSNNPMTSSETDLEMTTAEENGHDNPIMAGAENEDDPGVRAEDQDDPGVRAENQDDPGVAVEDQVSETSDTPTDGAAAVLRPADLLWRGGIMQATALSAVASSSGSASDWRSQLMVSGLRLHNSDNSLNRAPPRNSIVEYGYYKDLMMPRPSVKSSESDAPAQSKGADPGVTYEPQYRRNPFGARSTSFYRRPERDYPSELRGRRATIHHVGDGAHGASTSAGAEPSTTRVFSQADGRQNRYRQGESQGQGHSSNVKGHAGHDGDPDPDYPVWNELPATEEQLNLPRLLFKRD